MRMSALAVIVATAWSALAMPLAAQWIRYPTAAVPRTRDGKPDLAARTPRTADGRPDLSGVWQNDGYGPPGGEGVGATPKTVFFDLVHGMNGAPPFQPWAATLAAQRRHDEAKDNPDARCLPLGPLQMLAHPLPKKILQSRGLVRSEEHTSELQSPDTISYAVFCLKKKKKKKKKKQSEIHSKKKKKKNTKQKI